MEFVRIARPKETALKVEDVKANERIRHGFEDEIILRGLRAAEMHIERITNRSIMRQAFRLTTTQISQSLKLLYPPMEGPVELTLATAQMPEQDLVQYDVDLLKVSIVDQIPTAHFSAVSRSAAGRVGSMVVEYWTGAAKREDVPADIQMAILMLASYYYKNREAATSDTRVSTIEKAVPFGVRQLVRPYRIMNVNAPYYAEAVR